MVKPIKPSEVAGAKETSIPDAVIEAFNELIVEKNSGHQSVVAQRAVVARIKAKLRCTAELIFDSGWLDVEDIYRKAGWRVLYDKPAYNETYEPTFTFTQKK